MHASMARSDDVAQHFDAGARVLPMLDVDKTWNAATAVERRVLIGGFLWRSSSYLITLT